MPKKPKNLPYGSEADLCDAFAATIHARGGWSVWPEVRSWDLVLVNDTTGKQIGVEAKMRCNLDVVANVLANLRYGPRPHALAVLVPWASPSLHVVCRPLKIEVFDHRDIVTQRVLVQSFSDVAEALELPEVALQSGGGRPSPGVMSKWRIAALRLCIMLDDTGHLSSQDFRDAGVDAKRWIEGRWIIRDGDVMRADGKPGKWARYVRGDRPGPDAGYEAERDAVRRKDKNEPPT